LSTYIPSLNSITSINFSTPVFLVAVAKAMAAEERKRVAATVCSVQMYLLMAYSLQPIAVFCIAYGL
jgi:hypothetical protein